MATPLGDFIRREQERLGVPTREQVQQDLNDRVNSPEAWDELRRVQEQNAQRSAQRSAVQQAEARSVAPTWLSGVLLDAWTEAWLGTRDPNVALEAVRRSPAYDQAFYGNRREDGSLRYNENQWLATRDAFTETAAEFGVGTLDRSTIEQLFNRDISAQEFVSSVGGAFSTFAEPGVGAPASLMSEYLSGFTGTGSSVEAMARVRQSSAYGDIFRGNRREDGTLRMEEQDWYAYRRGWQRTLASYGLDPDFFDGRGRFVAAVEGEVSVAELGDRVLDGAGRSIGWWGTVLGVIALGHVVGAVLVAMLYLRSRTATWPPTATAPPELTFPVVAAVLAVVAAVLTSLAERRTRSGRGAAAALLVVAGLAAAAGAGVYLVDTLLADLPVAEHAFWSIWWLVGALGFVLLSVVALVAWVAAWHAARRQVLRPGADAEFEVVRLWSWASAVAVVALLVMTAALAVWWG